ncbi:heterokaryon incompatibility, partial [Phyllosticta citribraziliensis]
MDTRFAALSYVWGDCQNSIKLKASLENITRLMKPGAFTSDQIPKTINDAIDVCIKLDIPYLWADRLCILQDDEEDIHQQVQSMDKVFSSAYVVLAA